MRSAPTLLCNFSASWASLYQQQRITNRHRTPRLKLLECGYRFMHSLPLPIAAFVAGLLSFLSPCVLPLVPGYVSLISGASVDDLQSTDRRMLGTVMLHSATFILGFSLVFIALGAVATSIGQLANEYHTWLARIAGIIVIIFGLHLTGVWKIK